MKRSLIVIAGLIAVALVACGGTVTEITKGKLVTGIITASDDNVEGWKSQTYVVDVFKDVEYFIRLTSTEGDVMGVWSAEADGYLVKVDPEVPARTTAHTFSESGPQELFLRSPDSDVPSPFTFKLWAPTDF